MQIPVTDELLAILREICEEGRSEDEWSGIESDDMFQRASFDGGFDATERAFCFSFYDANGSEYWFQLTLDEAFAVLDGRMTVIEGRPAESQSS